MKKLILMAIVASLSLAPFGAHAQESARTTGQKVASGEIYRSKMNRFGVRGGKNWASTTDCVIRSSGNTIEIEGSCMEGFYAGLFDNYSFSNRFGLQVEALFSTQGDAEDRLSYINIPLLLDVRPVKELGILVGPQMGVNVARPDNYNDSHTVATRPEGIPTEELYRIAYNNETAPIDFGVVLGVQCILGKHLLIDVRYTIGLTPVRTFKGIGAEVSGYTHRVFQLGAGLLF
jgi:hypothetical protein